MKKNRVIQISLLGLALILIFFTYYSNKSKEAIIGIQKDLTIKPAQKLTKDVSNIIENAKYAGTDNRGTSFKLTALAAKVFYDKPNISNMNDVDAEIRMRDGKTIYIKSDQAIYDQTTNDAKFMGNVLITETDNIIKSENLDLFMSKNLITIYNNVKYNGINGFLIADKVDIDILTNEAKIFMFEKNNKVRIKYKN